MFLITPIAKFSQNVAIFIWDGSLTFFNFVTPSIPVGHVVPEGHPGAGGKWPEYVAPKEGDSRSACPGLNAMANHGILPRDGRNISFKELNRAVNATFNFSPSFSLFVTKFAANMLKKSYSKDNCDLADISLHNGIEHDASLTREDLHFQPDQGAPHLQFVRELLESATGKDKEGNPLLTVADISRYSSKRRAEARAKNPEFSLSFFHGMFGSQNSSTFPTIFGSRVRDLEPILIEERIPEGWESRVRGRKGLTMHTLNVTAIRVGLGINEKKFATTVADVGDTSQKVATAA